MVGDMMHILWPVTDMLLGRTLDDYAIKQVRHIGPPLLLPRLTPSVGLYS